MLRIKSLYRKIDGRVQVICGHLTKQEVAEFKREGWRVDQPQINRNGIPVRS